MTSGRVFGIEADSVTAFVERAVSESESDDASPYEASRASIISLSLGRLS